MRVKRGDGEVERKRKRERRLEGEREGAMVACLHVRVRYGDLRKMRFTCVWGQ